MFAPETDQTRLAVDFAKHLAAGDFSRAHSTLSADLQAQVSAADLASRYRDMTSYGEGPASVIQAVTTLQEWPGKKPSDVEWVYVAIANDSYSEAITVVVSRDGTRLAVNSIEWGRP